MRTRYCKGVSPPLLSHTPPPRPHNRGKKSKNDSLKRGLNNHEVRVCQQNHKQITETNKVEGCNYPDAKVSRQVSRLKIF